MVARSAVLSVFLAFFCVAVDGVQPSIQDLQLSGAVVPQSIADAFGAKCLDGTPPAFYYVSNDTPWWMISGV